MAGVASPRPELWLVRHGETEWSRDGRHTSSTDLPLTAAGEREAIELRPRLAEIDFQLVLTSPMLRSTRTAELAEHPEATRDADLVEWNYGAYEGVSTAEIRVDVPGWTVWTHPTPSGESADQVAARVDRALARMAESGARRTLVFTHAHVGRVVAARWLDLDPTDGRLLRLGTGTISVLGWDHEQRAIVTWNC